MNGENGLCCVLGAFQQLRPEVPSLMRVQFSTQSLKIKRPAFSPCPQEWHLDVRETAVTLLLPLPLFGILLACLRSSSA